MFSGLNCEKFKFADDGNLLVIQPARTNTVPQLALNCQIILNQLEIAFCSERRNDFSIPSELRERSQLDVFR